MKPCCELCKSPAKIYCDSDQASLCWTCDNKVHSANFLVARHSRTLLCCKCHSPTPWTAAGEKLGPSAVSICEKCVMEDTSDDDDESEEENNEDDDYDEDSETELHVGDDDHNQIVPLCYTPPPPASSSSSDDCSVGDTTVFVKRKRVNDTDLCEVYRGKRTSGWCVQRVVVKQLKVTKGGYIISYL
ncbi:zinc finger protein CONSTANS-LIKE 9 isoform X2 [Helianthus annuus]|uniref:zinc finger protein CONSTANS-LIKE 9 isoform X2 n=1 Tax=Helianthus annuus TaxID=4232 RepID=UPI000B8F7715|nr:zinc finger protein CONSTANS-LIKE 9 isoform X2 [Helianthus annuus]